MYIIHMDKYVQMSIYMFACSCAKFKPHLKDYNLKYF